MPERGGRTPIAGFFLGLGLAAGAGIIAWLAYEQSVRAQRAASSTFDFRRIDWLWSQALFVAVGVLFGLIILLALRGPSRTRRVTLLGATIPPLLILGGFWWYLYIGFPSPFAGFITFLVDPAAQIAAAVAVGILLILAVVPTGSHHAR